MANTSERMVKLIAKQLKVNVDQVSPHAKFRDDLKATSLALILLQIAMEEEFSLELKEEDAIGITTLQTALDYLASKGIKD